MRRGTVPCVQWSLCSRERATYEKGSRLDARSRKINQRPP